MDPSYTGQDITRCDLCETSVVQKYCDICRVNLCISCVGIHISDEYDRHKVVPFSRRNSTLIYPPCKIHTSKRCKFRCDNCDLLLCSLCSSSSAHERHKHSNTFEVYRSKKELIKNDAEKLENKVLPACKEMEKDIEAHISNIDEAFERVILAVENHGKYWHKKIDFILREMKDNIGQIKKRQTEFLKKNLTKLQTLSSVLQKRILDLKNISKSNKISDAIAYISNNELLKLPSKVKVTPPQFQPNLDEELTLDEFGTLTPGALSTEDQSYSMVKQDLPSSKHDKILLEKPNIIATLVTGTASSVANDNDENIWTSSYSNSIIQCHCMQRSISKHMAFQSGQILRDITVNNEGDLLYISQKRCTESKMEQQKMFIYFLDGHQKTFVELKLVIFLCPCTVMIKHSRELSVTMDLRKNKRFSLMTTVNPFTQAMTARNTFVKMETVTFALQTGEHVMLLWLIKVVDFNSSTTEKNINTNLVHLESQQIVIGIY